MGKDYYKILNLGRNATKAEITQRFKVLAKEHHPDRGGSSDRFKEINEAYSVLRNEELRKEYDMQTSGFPGWRQDGFSNDARSGFSNDARSGFSNDARSGFSNGRGPFGFSNAGRTQGRNEFDPFEILRDLENNYYTPGRGYQQKRRETDGLNQENYTFYWDNGRIRMVRRKANQQKAEQRPKREQNEDYFSQHQEFWKKYDQETSQRTWKNHENVHENSAHHPGFFTDVSYRLFEKTVSFQRKIIYALIGLNLIFFVLLRRERRHNYSLEQQLQEFNRESFTEDEL